jgi:hypothetical protein
MPEWTIGLIGYILGTCMTLLSIWVGFKKMK